VLQIEHFLIVNKNDILLNSESHATLQTVIKILYYEIYYANHPYGTECGGSAIIIKSSIKQYILQPHITNKIQGTTSKLETFDWPLTIAAIYSPPRQALSSPEYKDFLLSLGSRSMAAGDWGAKHMAWGSRLITSKGRVLYKTIQENNLNILSTGEPTYWPTDYNKIPDLLDFAVTKCISDIYSIIESNLDLSSDFSPIIITIRAHVVWKNAILKLCTRETNWELFRDILNEKIRLDYRMKRNDEIEEAVQYLTPNIQDASWKATPSIHIMKEDKQNTPLHIRQLISE
jgi:hypothetical protein